VDQDFYLAFENRFRGSREVIAGRQRFYLQFVRPLAKLYPEVPVLDLGCGRGEWVQLLREEHIPARGFDMSQVMVDVCRSRGLSVAYGSALEILAGQPDESVLAVSAFHLVEHIPFDDVRAMVQQAKRVLVPGGILMMETPNPENIVVGSHTFYMDPTHERPIPPQTLAFIPEYYGFGRSHIYRLNEPDLLMNQVQLLDVLTGVSPDYAVIAQKKGDESVSICLDSAFGLDTGHTLAEVATAYQEQYCLSEGNAASAFFPGYDQIGPYYTRFSPRSKRGTPISRFLKKTLRKTIDILNSFKLFLSFKTWLKYTHPRFWMKVKGMAIKITNTDLLPSGEAIQLLRDQAHFAGIIQSQVNQPIKKPTGKNE
jgi:SAM-dependent methyltransferase